MKIALIIAGALADLLSTEWALSFPGNREGNLILAARWVRVGLKVVVVMFLWWLLRLLPGQGGWILAVIASGLWFAAAAWNVRLALKGGR